MHARARRVLVGLSRTLLVMSVGLAVGTAWAEDGKSSVPMTYRAKTSTSYHLAVAFPTDQRSQHVGDPVRENAGWKGCQADYYTPHNPPGELQNRITRAFRDSRLFDGVTMAAPASTDLVLSMELDALCGQKSGVVFGHATGAAMAHVVLRKRDQVLFEQSFERVVTEGDPEYSASAKDFSGEPAQAAMNDALRALSIDVVKAVEASVSRW